MSRGWRSSQNLAVGHVPWNCPVPALGTVIHWVETVVHRVVLHSAFWWAALEHTEGKKTGQRGEAEHKRGLLAGEIRRHPDEVLDGLVAQILRELLGAVRGVAH